MAEEGKKEKRMHINKIFCDANLDLASNDDFTKTGSKQNSKRERRFLNNSDRGRGDVPLGAAYCCAGCVRRRCCRCCCCCCCCCCRRCCCCCCRRRCCCCCCRCGHNSVTDEMVWSGLVWCGTGAPQSRWCSLRAGLLSSSSAFSSSSRCGRKRLRFAMPFYT
jgi:hypothetical protein